MNEVWYHCRDDCYYELIHDIDDMVNMRYFCYLDGRNILDGNYEIWTTRESLNRFWKKLSKKEVALLRVKLIE